jgi:hypothetical protein
MPVVPKTSLGFVDLLEGFTEFRKTIIFTHTVYYSGTTQIKINKEKIAQDRVLENPSATL